MSNLPKGWKEITLSEVCTKIQDGNYGSFYPKSHEFLESGIPFLTSKAIGSNGILIPSKIDYISPEKHAELKKAHLKLNDILFTNRGANVGAIGIVEENILHGNIGPQLTLLRANEKITPKFLLYSMRSSLVQKQIESNDSGSAMNFFGIKETSKFKLYLPPLEEQKKIADILSTVDKKIVFVEENINATEELKKGLMQKLLTEGIGHTEFKDSELGRIPESWEVVTLNKYCNIFMSNVDKKSNSEEEKVLLCNYMDIYNNNYITNEISFMEATASSIQIEKFSLNVGDIMITKDSETKFDIARSSVVIENLQNVLCGYHLALIKPDKNKFNSIFLTKIFDLDLYRKQLINKANGTTRFGLNVSTIENFLIPFPPLEEQKQIAEILLTIDNKLENLKEKKQSFEELKKGLMQKLLTGEVRV